MQDLSLRSAQQVFDDHLALAQQGRLEEDLQRNYADDCLVLTDRGVFRGHPGIRLLAVQLQREIPDARYDYVTRSCEGRFAYLQWTADCGAVAVHDGADSFVIENGKVVAQTIHYTLSVRDPERLPGLRLVPREG